MHVVTSNKRDRKVLLSVQKSAEVIVQTRSTKGLEGPNISARGRFSESWNAMNAENLEKKKPELSEGGCGEYAWTCRSAEYSQDAN